MKSRFSFSGFMLWVGLAFIYLPMVILVIYSFNASRLVTVWGGWSTRWYAGLLSNTQLMSAVERSLQIAFFTATAAVQHGSGDNAALGQGDGHFPESLDSAGAEIHCRFQKGLIMLDQIGEQRQHHERQR